LSYKDSKINDARVARLRTWKLNVKTSQNADRRKDRGCSKKLKRFTDRVYISIIQLI